MSAERIPIANVYYLLCYAWRHVHERDLVELDALDELDRVHDLLATVLVQGAFRLARQGIDRGYRDVREDLAGIRGKVDVGRTVKRALRGRGQVACAFEELTLDVPHNRILRSTLSALLRVRDLDRDVRAGVRSAYEKLAGVTVVRVTRRMFDQVQLDGNRRYYRFLLSVCRLVQDLLLVDPRSGEHRFSGLTDAVTGPGVLPSPSVLISEPQPAWIMPSAGTFMRARHAAMPSWIRPRRADVRLDCMALPGIARPQPGGEAGRIWC